MEEEVKPVELKGRARLRAMAQKLYPDKQYADDSEDDIDDMVDAHEKHAATSQRLAEGIKAHPGFASVIGSLVEGKHPMHAVVAHYGKDIMGLDPESEEFAQILAADDEHTRKMEEIAMKEAESKSGEEEHQKKLSDAGKVLEEFATSKGWDEAATTEFLNKVQEQIVTPILELTYTPEFFEAADKWVNHDEHVDDAQKQGMDAGIAAGKTQKIIAKEQQLGDGIPALRGGGAVAPKEKKPQGEMDFWAKAKASQKK